MIDEESLEPTSCVGCGDPLKVPYGAPSICSVCLHRVQERGQTLKEGSKAVAAALEMVENDFCNLCHPMALDLCKVLADEIHRLRGTKPPPQLIHCSHCGKDVADNEVYKCDDCLKDGLCNNCVESWQHWCVEDQIEHKEDEEDE